MAAPVKDKKHRGAESEMIACAWLLANGYEVFRNVSQHGDVDIVGWKAGSFESFDVKTLDERHILRSLSKNQMDRGVQILAVDSVTNSCRLIVAAVWEDRLCKRCGGTFKLKVRAQLFCNPSCKEAYHNGQRGVCRSPAGMEIT